MKENTSIQSFVRLKIGLHFNNNKLIVDGLRMVDIDIVISSSNIYIHI